MLYSILKAQIVQSWKF